jgi:hypothetical protein
MSVVVPTPVGVNRLLVLLRGLQIYATYLLAIEMSKAEETIAAETELRQSKYLNHVIEQDHRNIK